MVWQDAFPPTGGPNFNAEDERERRLAAQARAGAEWALTALIARYQPTVVRYLTRLCGNPTQARNLAERIFQRMERRLHGPHGAEQLRLWLLRACTEAGLDALRRPQSAPTPRLGGSGVAGLLADVSGKDAPTLLQHGLRRLRQVTNGANRQANPLVWANDAPHAGANEAPDANESHLDETLDHLDPREALRHRLVRVTLAEMPYGDAQCLALHLVAGLNQAEVAKALGITNSAARKRIVHGLALFSERYTQAVQSLGLPVELGFGDAIPRAPMQPEPVPEPAPPPVVVSAQASEAAPLAPGEDRLISVNPTTEREPAPLSGVSYLSDDSGKTAAIVTGAAPEIISQPETFYDAPYDEDDAIARAEAPDELDAAHYARSSVVVAVDESDTLEYEAPVVESEPAPMSGGLITRVAADAIVGPIVDALPVIPASAIHADAMGLASPHSMPLAYELNSNAAHEPQSIRMNWLDDAGLMTPLTFESVAVAASAENTPHESSPLSFEAVAVTTDTPYATHESGDTDDTDDTLSLELTQSSTDEPLVATLVAEPVDTEDEEPMALVDEPALTPITVPVLTLPEDEASVGKAGVASPTEETHIAPRAERGVITRSLEALWDELPEGIDL